MIEYDKKAILWLQVPVTGSELNALMRRANLLGTGTAWEALRERTDLPDKPNGYVKWAREQEKIEREARKEQEKFTATLIASSVTAVASKSNPQRDLFNQINAILDEDNDDPIGMTDWWSSPNRFIDPVRKPTPLAALLDGTLTIEQIEVEADVNSRGMG